MRLAALLSALALLAPTASAQPIVISSGAEDGYYDALAGRLRVVLDAELGEPPPVHSSEGSIQNLERLEDPASPVNVALAQADALKIYLDAHPGFADEIVFLADIGRECAFLVTSKKHEIRSVADLKRGDGARLGLPREQSGAAATFRLIQSLNPASQTEPVHLRALEALLMLRNRGAGQPLIPGQPRPIDAVLFVQRPRAVPPIEIVLENLETFRFVPIRSGDVPSAKLPDGRPIYTFESVQLGFGRDFSASVETMCTRGLLIGSNPKLSEKATDLLLRVLIDSASYIMPGRR